MKKTTKTGTIISTHWHKGYVIHFELLHQPAENDAVVYCRDLGIEIMCKSDDDIRMLVQDARNSIDLKLTRNDVSTTFAINT